MSSSSNQVQARAAAVTGASHLRVARNGQDAAAAWQDGPLALAVVCDGCGSGARSELGAQVVARRMRAALARRLRAGAAVADLALWSACRSEAAAELARLARSWCPEELDGSARPLEAPGALAPEAREALGEALLCTVLVAAADRRDVAVWAIGDGAVVLGGELTVLGPFLDNAPPYLGYDVLGHPPTPYLRVRPRGAAGVAAVATDGAAELGDELTALVHAPSSADHPDLLRRTLARWTRGEERVRWAERRIDRAPARLQDDAAVGLVRWSAEEAS